MKVHRLDPPKVSDYYDPSELSGYALNYIASAGAEEVWYWYSQGSYEGAGYLLARKGNEWAFDCLSHCS
jgi:hypothetical protein